MTSEGLRERKKRETRLALSHATIRLALERGWDNVSVEDVAAAANVSERTFRNYFTSKAEAVVATHVERGQRIAEVLRERPADEPLWDALVAAVVAQFEPAESGPRDDGYATALQGLLAQPAIQHEVFRAHTQAQDELTAAIRPDRHCRRRAVPAGPRRGGRGRARHRDGALDAAAGPVARRRAPRGFRSAPRRVARPALTLLLGCPRRRACPACPEKGEQPWTW
jgi:AcrR family transcriptional regulator